MAPTASNEISADKGGRVHDLPPFRMKSIALGPVLPDERYVAEIEIPTTRYNTYVDAMHEWAQGLHGITEKRDAIGLSEMGEDGKSPLRLP